MISYVSLLSVKLVKFLVISITRVLMETIDNENIPHVQIQAKEIGESVLFMYKNGFHVVQGKGSSHYVDLSMPVDTEVSEHYN